MTTHLYTLAGPPDAIGEAIAIPWVAEALDHEDLTRLSLAEQTDSAGVLGDASAAPAGETSYSEIPNSSPITVRHTSRMVYQGPQ